MRILFSRLAFKRHISNVKKSRLSQGLPISIKDRVIFPFREGFIFTKIKSSRKFPNLQYPSTVRVSRKDLISAKVSDVSKSSGIN